MKKVLEAVIDFFTPHSALLLILTLGSAAGLYVVFTNDLQEHWMVYGLYSIAAYATVCVSFFLLRGIKWGRKAVHRNAFAHRYLTDLDFKGSISLQMSLGINTVYAILKGAAGILYHSPWFGALSCYYFVLAVERFLLMWNMNRREDSARILCQYRGAGYTLLILTPTLLAIGFQAILDREGAAYPGYMIYAAAGFTFYSFGTSVYNLFRYRRLKDPIHLANKMLSMASALISLFFLQTAMLNIFDDGSGFATVINPITGIVILLLVMGLGVYMIRDASEKLKKL